jgi:endonuclease YncB( thermonuclease family)
MRYLFSLCFLVTVLPVFSQISGRVISVYDGDTFTMLDSERKEVIVRLHGVDCPELAQNFGERAKQFTSYHILDRIISVKVTETDRYGRKVGVVPIIDSTSLMPQTTTLNELLLTEGFAWHHKQYDKSKEFAQLEAEARNKKLGLWSVPNPVAPWKYRNEDSPKKGKKSDNKNY